MRGGMRHKALLFLGFVLLAVAVACGGTAEPTVDIEATVEARLTEKRVAEEIVPATSTFQSRVADKWFRSLNCPVL